MASRVSSHAGSDISIHYRRPPDRVDTFVNRLVHRAPGVIVTIMEATPLERPMVIAGETALEDGAPVVWFTFPDTAHDVGRFHRLDGTFTGYYANILTPVIFHDECTWETTDLFLDVWLRADGHIEVLDQDELAAAEDHGWISAGAADNARAEAARLTRAAAAGQWPPPVVHEWTLEKTRALLEYGTTERDAV